MKNKIFNILSILFALMMINSGLNKFFNYIPIPADLPAEVIKDNAALMEIVWLMPLIASVEIIGGLLIVFTKTRAIGALMILPIMTGILLVHTTVSPAELPIALVFTAILAWILFEYRHRYLQLLNNPS